MLGLPAAAIEAVEALHRDLEAAVLSHLGLELVLLANGSPVTLTMFRQLVVRSDITTSLHVPLSALGDVRNDSASVGPGSAVTFYAATPGTFVDLATDLSYLHGRRRGTPPGSGPVAWGIRLDQGHEPDHAHRELTRRAAVAGVTVLVCAAQLLRSLSADE